MTTKLQVTVGSDDLIDYDFEGEGEEVGTPTMDFNITLPSGEVLPLNVDYSSWGWRFSLELPEGTEVEAIPPEEE